MDANSRRIPQSIGEEIANSISHGIGSALAIAGTAVLITSACFVGTAIDIVSTSLYGFSMIFLFLMSTLYHAITNERAKKVFQILDHCSIFILIIGTYIPICLSLFKSALGWTLFGIDLGLAIIGVTLTAIDMIKYKKFSMFMYILIGWSVVLAFKPLLDKITLPGIILLIGGGLFYSVGIIFYKAKKPKFMHSIWHIMVLGGSVLHYFFILFYVILK